MEPWSMWVIGGVILLIVEMITPGLFVFACFGVAAFVAALASGLGAGVIPTWSLFLGASVLFIVVAQRWATRFFRGRGRPSNIDELIGKDAFVTEKIEPYHPGVVKIGGEMWRAESNAVLPVNSVVRIVGVEGTLVRVEKKEVV